MKLDKLVRQFRREAAANPKKTAVLGLMVLVALYFWGPLVWGWIGPSDSGRRVQPVALILTDDPVDPAQQQAAIRKAAAFRWDKVGPQMRDDRLMTSAAFDPMWSDPFALRQPEAAGVLATSTPAQGDVTPREAGLVLTSVVVGSRQRTATINGKTVVEGDRITVSGQGETLPVAFHVVRIERDSVELERGGRRFRLELRQPTLASGDVIQPSGK